MANTVSERIVTGRKYRIFTGVIGRLWDRISFWTKASDVEIDVKDERGTITGTQSLQEFADDIGNMVQDMTGATSSTDGEHGLVPAPQAGDERKVLSGAGTWIDHDAGYTFDTIEEMEEALPNIPEDSTIFVGEESPTAITGDPALSDTSENWVKNKVVSRTIGKLTQLTTTATTNLVAAINELRGKFDANYLLPLTAGGTGASTALAARKNLKANGSGNIAVTEATRTMSAQRAAGSYVYVTADDQLYVITTTIASGGTLTPGTNATAKNVGEVLQTLNSDLASYGKGTYTVTLAGFGVINNAGTTLSVIHTDVFVSSDVTSVSATFTSGSGRLYDGNAITPYTVTNIGINASSRDLWVDIGLSSGGVSKVMGYASITVTLTLA